MADSSVFIEGVGEGAFTEAFSGLPPWATESTAWKIQGILEKQLGIQNKMLAQLTRSALSSSGDPATQARANKEFEKYVKDLVAANKAAERDKKRAKEKDDANKQSLLTGKKLTTSGQKLDYVLTGLAAIGSKVLSSQTQYIKTYDELYNSGVNLLAGNNSTADGFQSLNQMVNATGMRLETLQKTLVKFSDTINAVGATKFTKALAKSIPEMTKLGYSSQEAADLMGSYLDIQSNVTDQRVKSEQEIIKGTLDFANQLNKLSLATGKSKDQLLENLKTTAKSNDFALIAAQKGDKAANSIMEFSAQFGKGTQDMLMRFSSASAAQLTDMYQALNASGQGGLADKIAQVAKLAETDQAQAKSMLESLVPEIKNALKNGGLRELRDTKHSGAEETITAFSEIIQSTNRQSKATDEQTDAATKTKAATAALGTELERTAALTQAAFSPMISQVNAAADALRMFNDAMYKGISGIESNTRSWIGLGLMVAGLGASIAVLIGKIKTFASLLDGVNSNKGMGKPGKGKVGGTGGKPGGMKGLVKGGGAVAAVVGAGLAGWEIGTALNDNLIAGTKFGDAIGSGIAHTLAFFGNKTAQDSIDAQKKFEESQATSVNKAPVAVKLPENTKVTTKPDETKKAPDTKTSSPSAGTTAAAASANATQPRNSDINSQVAYQTSILEQMLAHTQNLVSVNREILKFTRIQS